MKKDDMQVLNMYRSVTAGMFMIIVVLICLLVSK